MKLVKWLLISLGAAFALYVAASVLGVLALSWIIANPGGRRAHYRYELTLSLDTPDGVKTGHNVVEIDYADVVFPMKGTTHVTHGQGVYVDMGPGRRPLIALLTHIRRSYEVASHGHDYHYRWSEDDPGNVLKDACLGGPNRLDLIDSARAFDERCRQPSPITTADLPDLVTFADIDDPASIMLVDPDDLEATLGSGVKWRSMTINVTDDDTTNNEHFDTTWISNKSIHMKITGLTTFDGLSAEIYPNSFKTPE